MSCDQFGQEWLEDMLRTKEFKHVERLKTLIINGGLSLEEARHLATLKKDNTDEFELSIQIHQNLSKLLIEKKITADDVINIIADGSQGIDQKIELSEKLKDTAELIIKNKLTLEQVKKFDPTLCTKLSDLTELVMNDKLTIEQIDELDLELYKKLKLNKIRKLIISDKLTLEQIAELDYKVCRAIARQAFFLERDLLSVDEIIDPHIASLIEQRLHICELLANQLISKEQFLNLSSDESQRLDYTQALILAKKLEVDTVLSELEIEKCIALHELLGLIINDILTVDQVLSFTLNNEKLSKCYNLILNEIISIKEAQKLSDTHIDWLNGLATFIDKGLLSYPEEFNAKVEQAIEQGKDLQQETFLLSRVSLLLPFIQANILTKEQAYQLVETPEFEQIDFDSAQTLIIKGLMQISEAKNLTELQRIELKKLNRVASLTDIPITREEEVEDILHPLVPEASPLQNNRL